MSEPTYLDFTSDEWAALRANTPLTLTESDLEKIRGINVNLDIDMVEHSFLPLSRLLNLHVQGSHQLATVTDTFLGAPPRPRPFVIGVAGSVAVGKSTISRVLQELLARWPQHPRVELVTTDGFLYPNAVLEERGLMDRKGFPESYDRRALLEFVARAKGGADHLEVPVYSHFAYDVLEGETRGISRPDILILEGLNVLQAGGVGAFVSDYFDFSIFVDADPEAVRGWYIETVHHASRYRLHPARCLFPSLRRPQRREGGSGGFRYLGPDQRGQPLREHPPHPGTGESHPEESPGSLDREGPSPPLT